MRLPDNPWKFTVAAWPVIATLTISLCFLTQVVAGWFGITLPEQTNVELIRKMLGWNRVFFINMALIIVVLPAVEELVFRGLLFRLPVRCAGNRRQVEVAAGSVSSVMFSAAHYLMQPFPDNAFIALFFFGVAQCWLYRRTGRIGCAMLNHALFNLTNLLLLFVIPA